jgi:hypothetical protein
LQALPVPGIRRGRQGASYDATARRPFSKLVRP